MSARLQGQSLILHGPGAYEAAVERTSSSRVLMEGPLTVDAARDLVAKIHEGGLRVGTEVALFGPVDESAPAAVDALLKVLEEGVGDIRVILWALDEGEVAPTLRSRCQVEWCYGGPEMPSGRSWEDLWGAGADESPRALLEDVATSLARVPATSWTAGEAALWMKVREGLLSRTTSTGHVDGVRVLLAGM